MLIPPDRPFPKMDPEKKKRIAELTTKKSQLERKAELNERVRILREQGEKSILNGTLPKDLGQD